MQLLATSPTLQWPQSSTTRAVTVALRVTGMALLAMVGYIHLDLASFYSLQANYIGVLFCAACAGAVLSATAIGVGIRGAWILGSLVAVGSFAGLILSATIGLPGFVDSLQAPRAMLSLWLEGGFVATYAAAIAIRRTPFGA